MTALAKHTTTHRQRESVLRTSRRGKFLIENVSAGYVTVTRAALADAIEDAELNAIADERADGPFVRVSLDDL